ncbi:hypothetical protein OF83DRAFT_1113891 [Amylostereum chailletii]|nr:hypothetical protein OF83DRAFT_1113891 [Amylostereum chailletii]
MMFGQVGLLSNGSIISFWLTVDTEGTPRMSNSHSRALPIQNTLAMPEDAGFKLEGSDATAVGSPRDFSMSRDNTPTAVSSQTTSTMEDKDIAVPTSLTARLTRSQSPAVISSDEQKSVPLGHSEHHLGKQNRRERRSTKGSSKNASDSTLPEHLLPLSEDPMGDGVSTHEKHPALPTPAKAKTETLSRNPTPSTTPVDADGIPIFQCGLRTINGDYIPLSAVKIGKIVSVIAVVTSVRNVIRTRKGDWSQSVSLIDPSNFEQFGRMLYTEGAGIKLTVKSHQDSPSLIGYTDKLEWTLFQPDTHEFTHGDLKDAPRSANLAGGFGAEFSPFWTGTKQEREYCVKICEWWAAVQRARGKRMGSDIVQIGGGDGPVEIGRYAPRKFTAREHRLIKDADGYFNCTVEFLHGQSLSPGMYTIWVTDYTSKQGAQEVTTEWCPANLSTKVFRVELWEEAVDLGPKMKPGEFWSIGNMRMKTDSRGFYEGSFSEVRKAHRLEPDEAQYNPYLKELFERKEAWEESNVSPNEFPHKTLAEVTLSEIFDCTVEVFHTEPNPDGTSRVYVSDYTERPDLTRPPRAARVEGMDNYIVTIELRDGQSEMASMMETGSFFRIGHLRLQKRYTGDGKVLGQLGGHDRLINKVSKNAKDPGLASLLQQASLTLTWVKCL